MILQGRRFWLGAGLGAAVASRAGAQPAGWLTRPVTLIVPWAPGGGTDAMARALGRSLSTRLGVPVPVMNRPGGNGTIGHVAIRDAAPDGHTIGFIGPQLITGPLLGSVPITWPQVQPLALINTDPGAITVGAQRPWRSLADFVEAARHEPRSLRVGNSGQGGAWHLTALELEKKAGIELIHVPYASAGPALQDMVGGHIDAVSFSAAEARTPVAGGQARMLAVAAPERVATYPDVPTAREQGFDVDVSTWRGLGTSRGTPAPILARLEEAIHETMRDELVASFMAQQGFGMNFLGREGLAAFMAEQDRKYRLYFGS